MKILCLVGGAGTRLTTVTGIPKAMAEVGGRPFLELLVCRMRAQGFREFVMCIRHYGQCIRAHFGDGSRWNVSVQYSEEPQPLGTGGAIKFAAQKLGSDDAFAAINGDSFAEADFPALIQAHEQKRALATLALQEVPDAARFGTVEIAHEGEILRFVEKRGMAVPGLINAGIYVFSRKILEHIGEGKVSLERETFPKLVGQGLYGYRQAGFFIDIGIPEDYERAQRLSDRLHALAGLVPGATRGGGAC